MYPGNSEAITVCLEVYQINHVLFQSASNSSGFIEKCINFIRSKLVQVGSFDVTFNQDTYVHVHTCTCAYVSTVYHCYRKLENSCGCGHPAVTTGGSECRHTTSSVVQNSKKKEKTQECEFARRCTILYYKYACILSVVYTEETNRDTILCTIIPENHV